jgi:mono/diheme cytochrome c family protein
MTRSSTLALKAVAVVAACVGFALAALVANSIRKLDRVVEVTVAPLVSASGPDALAHGQYLYLSRCVDCHGADGTGRTFIDAPNGLYASGANLTRGAGSAVLHYTERDWVRAIRHGVKPNGRPVFVMPSEDFNRLSDVDLADLVAYLNTLPPKAGPGAVIRLPLLARLAHGAGVLKDAAQKIDHSQPPWPPVQSGVTVEHGRYVAQSCIGCHGKQFAGGRIAGAPPDWPDAARLSGERSVLGRYEHVDQFKTLLRTGVRPDGQLANTVMPRNQHLSDIDLEALYLFFKSIQFNASGA